MTATLAAPPALADVLLVRMAVPAKTPPPPSTLRKDVGNLLHGRDLSADEFAAVRDDLVAAGLVTVQGKSVRLTVAGRTKVREYLGLSEFPPRTTWKTVQAKYLFPRAAGLSPEAAGKLDTGDKLAAFLLKRTYRLPVGADASLHAVMEALACRELGHPEETTLEGLMRKVLSGFLGSEERLTKKQLAAQLPLYGTGLKSGSAGNIRQHIIRQGLAAAPRKSETPEEKQPASAEFDLSTFAATVQALARTSPPEDRFHGNKVFIAAVWRASQREDGFPRMTLPEFKARLVEANRDGLLHLSRADLVQAMDPVRVAESETHYLTATFHFILIEEAQP